MGFLDSDEGSGVVSALQAGRAWNIPPLTILADRPNQWRPEDTLLARALLEYESTRLNSLGIPKRLAEDRENSRRFVVNTSVVDYSLAAMDRWQAQQRDAKRELPAGVRAFVEYKPPKPA